MSVAFSHLTSLYSLILTRRNNDLNSSTIDGLGSWCLEGWWSGDIERVTGSHSNPSSSHHHGHLPAV